MIEKFEDSGNSEDSEDKSDKKIFRLISIDFEGILDLECGYVFPNSNSDEINPNYEYYELNSNKCINGSKTKLIRRKKDT